MLSQLVSRCYYSIQGSLVTYLANQYSVLSKENVEAVVSRFFGIFMIIFQSSELLFLSFMNSYIL
jgi:hypothetical protein